MGLFWIYHIYTFLQVQTLETLLQAYDEEDAEGVKNALNCPFIKHMDPEYARLARDLPIPKGISTIPPPASIRHNAAPSYISPNASNMFSSNEVSIAVNKSIGIYFRCNCREMNFCYLSEYLGYPE